MAKEDVDAADDKAEDEAAAEGASSGGRKKLILFGVAGAVVLSLLGGGGYFFFLRPAPEAAEEKSVQKPVGFLEMREMTVNLAPDAGPDRVKILRFKISLEVKDPKLVAEIQPLMPRVEDTFQLFLRELRPSDLEGSGGLHRLREELLRRVNYAVYPAKVDAVLFKDLLVQ